MWTAWLLSDQIPAERVVLLEREICGTGPSGRNGGFCHGFADEVEQLETEWGSEIALSCIERSIRDVDWIEGWSEEQGIDIHYRKSGELIVSCDPEHDLGCVPMVEAATRVGLTREFKQLDRDEVHGRCSSELFRSGTFAASVATLHPGRLAVGLRNALLERGVRIFESTEVTGIGTHSGRAFARTRGGRVEASSAVLACGAASAGWPGLRRELTLTSSHMVITEPVPEVLSEIGWTGGEAIIDSRTLVHYMRTTADDRIAFGWGGGSIGWGSAPSGRESLAPRAVEAVAADAVRFFPQLEGRTFERAWGGPIDASPRHMPAVRPLSSGVWHACFGFTGNGVGPSRVCAGLLAQLAIDPLSDPGDLVPLVQHSPQKVPFEPFRHVGGSAIMRSINSLERAHERGRSASRVSRFVSTVPDRLGFRIGR